MSLGCRSAPTMMQVMVGAIGPPVLPERVTIMENQMPVESEYELLNTEGFGAAVGWDAVAELVEQQKTGSFLKLQNNESAIITFVGKPLAYFTHRVDSTDPETNAPIMGADGNVQKRLVVCDAVYKDRDCINCKNEEDRSLRTVCHISIMQASKDGKSWAFQAMSVIEGGPKLWKNRIMPVVAEWKSDHVFTIKRMGTGLQTDYSFSANRIGRTPDLIEKIKKAELDLPSLLDVVQINEPIG